MDITGRSSNVQIRLKTAKSIAPVEIASGIGEGVQILLPDTPFPGSSTGTTDML